MPNLKKHIKKRFLIEIESNPDLDKAITDNLDVYTKDDAFKIPKVKDIKTSLIQYDNGKIVQAFPHRHNGTLKWIPEPDPILILFHTAYLNGKEISKQRNESLLFIGNTHLNEGVINDLYKYFGLVSSFVISLFTALEAFINWRTANATYTKETIKKTEIYVGGQIGGLPVDIKINEVLPIITGKDFSKSHPLIYMHITNLKEFRNSIVHLKSSSDGHTPYDHIFKKSFQYNYEQALNAVKDFLNFYHPSNPNYIEECNCSLVD
jgi:hypothetical protein